MCLALTVVKIHSHCALDGTWGTVKVWFLNPTLRVQVPNNHILTQNQYYNFYYPKPKYLIIGYMDPLGYRSSRSTFCEGLVLEPENQKHPNRFCDNSMSYMSYGLQLGWGGMYMGMCRGFRGDL